MTSAITDPVLIFSVMVGVTLVAPLLSEKLRVPDMVLLLLAGAMLGPHGLGLLERNTAILLFGSVGLLYIMFLAGLEVDLHQFVHSRRRSIGFGLLTFAIPQGVGTLLGRYVLHMDWPASMLLASMFASHTLLAYPIASRLGIVRSEPVAVTIGATIITDILALMVLAVIADSARGITLSPMFWVGITLGLVILILVSLYGIPWLSRWFFSHNSENGSAQFLFVIGVVCTISYLSHYAKMEPIIGAFLAGIAFNRLIPRQSTLMNRVEFVGQTVFIPFFLISVGMLVNLVDLTRDPGSWLVALTMVCGVIVTKYCAAHSARLLFGYSRAEGQVMFGLSVVQAAATLAAVLVGFELGIFNESVLNGAIGMIMVTCPLGSWVVERYGRLMSTPQETRAGERRGEQRLLIPVANPQGASRLLDLAFVLRDESRQGIVHPITIIPDDGETPRALAEGEKIMAQCLAHAASLEMQVTPSVRIGANVSDGIVHTARDMHADMVMFGWGNDRKVTTRIFGSVRKRMLQECPTRLYFCRLVSPLNTTKRIIVPLPPQFERRDDSGELIQEAKRLAKQLGADLHFYLGDPVTAQRTRCIIDEAEPTMPVTYVEMPDWQSARHRLLTDIGRDDMALLPVERRLGAFWTPSLDRLPDVMATQFPSMNLIAAYPALRDAFPQDSSVDTNVTPIGRIVPVALQPNDELEQALDRMAAGHVAWSREQQEEVRQLVGESVRSYPVEMAPGIVLLHGHSRTVEATTLLLGSSERGWYFPGIDAPCRVMLVLISQRSQPSERHLAALAYLAKAFRSIELQEGTPDGLSASAIAHFLESFDA